MSLEKYKDILYMPHHVSDKHPQMDRFARAAQFSPFAALVGYDDMIDETNRRTEEFTDFGEDDKAELDKKLLFLLENIQNSPAITITYFVPDERKNGGRFETVCKPIQRVDLTMRKVRFADKTEISIDTITDLGGELFEKMP